MFFAGAGIQTGQVVGTTDPHAAYPITRPYGPADISATMYHSLGIEPESRVPDRLGRPRPDHIDMGADPRAFPSEQSESGC